MAKTLIVTGMFRSSISLVRDVMEEIFSGDSSIVQKPVFDESEPLSFHDDLFQRHKWELLFSSAPESFDFDTNDVRKAQDLVQHQKRELLWGWADSRTAVLFDLWEELLPEALYILVYRHPLDVLFSLLETNFDPNLSGDLSRAVTTWQYYNKRIHDFYLKNPERCVLVHSQSVVENPGKFLSLISEKFDLSLSRSNELKPLDSSCFPDSCVSSEVHAAFAKAFPDAAELYDALQSNTDLEETGQVSSSQEQKEKISSLLQWLPSSDRDQPFDGHLFLQCLLSILNRKIVSQSFGAFRSQMDFIKGGIAEREKIISDLQSDLNTQVKNTIGAHNRSESLNQQIQERDGTARKLSHVIHDYIVRLFQEEEKNKSLEKILSDRKEEYEEKVSVLIRFIQLLWNSFWVRMGRRYWTQRKKYLSRRNNADMDGKNNDTSMLHEFEELEKIFPELKPESEEEPEE